MSDQWMVRGVEFSNCNGSYGYGWGVSIRVGTWRVLPWVLLGVDGFAFCRWGDEPALDCRDYDFCVPRKGVAIWSVEWAIRWWRNDGGGAGRARHLTNREALFVGSMCSV